MLYWLLLVRRLLCSLRIRNNCCITRRHTDWLCFAKVKYFKFNLKFKLKSLIFKVNQRFSLWKATYEILDENKEPILKVLGPCCIWDGACCPCDNNFRVNSKNVYKLIINATIKIIFYLKRY